MKINQKNSTAFSRIAPAAVALALLVATAPAPRAQEQAQVPETYVASTHGEWTVRCAGADPNAAGAQTSESDDGKGDMAAADGSTAAPATETPAATRPNCVMVQIAHHSEQTELGISIIVVRQKIDSDVVSQMRITTPISVFLPAGVGLEIDGAAIGRLPYEVCSPAGVCVATLFVDADMEAKFKRGSVAQLFLKDVRGTDGVFALSLSGFTAAFDALNPGS